MRRARNYGGAIWGPAVSLECVAPVLESGDLAGLHLHVLCARGRTCMQVNPLCPVGWRHAVNIERIGYARAGLGVWRRDEGGGGVQVPVVRGAGFGV